jgi:putative transposase
LNAGAHTNGKLRRNFAGFGSPFEPNQGKAEQSEGKKARSKDQGHGIHGRGISRGDDCGGRRGNGTNHHKQQHCRCQKSDEGYEFAKDSHVFIVSRHRDIAALLCGRGSQNQTSIKGIFEELYRWERWALAPRIRRGEELALAAVMHFAEQEVRTFFVTSATAQRRAIFQTDRMALGLKDVFRRYRRDEKFELHSLVIMPDHFHALLTPAASVSLEKVVQFIKGGFSFKAKKELGFEGEMWTRGFNEHRILDWEDFEKHRSYIALNPSRRGLREGYEYVWPSIDPCPPWLKPQI